MIGLPAHDKHRTLTWTLQAGWRIAWMHHRPTVLKTSSSNQILGKKKQKTKKKNIFSPLFVASCLKLPDLLCVRRQTERKNNKVWEWGGGVTTGLWPTKSPYSPLWHHKVPTSSNIIFPKEKKTKIKLQMWRRITDGRGGGGGGGSGHCCSQSELGVTHQVTAVLKYNQRESEELSGPLRTFEDLQHGPCRTDRESLAPCSTAGESSSPSTFNRANQRPPSKPSSNHASWRINQQTRKIQRKGKKKRKLMGKSPPSKRNLQFFFFFFENHRERRRKAKKLSQN